MICQPAFKGRGEADRWNSQNNFYFLPLASMAVAACLHTREVFHVESTFFIWVLTVLVVCKIKLSVGDGKMGL